MLKPGQNAPEFLLPDADMKMVNLKDFHGKNNIVLYFYPKDDTTGCTIEAVELSDLMDEFNQLDALVFGISKDNCASHASFRDKHGLTVQLLADTEGEACKSYGVWQEKEKNGEKRMGIVRSTFVIDKQGILRQAMYDVKPKGHAIQVLDFIKEVN
ncbi:MAG: peroxiredoxin [Pseudomonadota bacterium]